MDDKNKKSITRKDFVHAFMSTGQTYAEATMTYETLVRVIEDGIVTGSKINFGRVCSLSPKWLSPRSVTKGFKRTVGGIKKTTNQTYYLGKRIRYKVNLFKEFTRTRSLNWF